MATCVFEHSDRTGIDRLGEVLRDHGQKLEIIRAHREEPIPVDLDGIDAIVICGGPQSPDDDSLPWLKKEMDLLRLAHGASLPIVGICLGCQILARALGGEVALLEDGVEWGFHEIELTPAGREDPLFAGLPWRSMQLSAHRYHVKTSPPAARVLASSKRTPIQAWGLGLRTYGMQYHPEAYPETVERWADDEPETLEEAGLTREQLRRQVEEHYPTFARLAQRLFESMALMLMPVDRRYVGAIRDLHH
jgi:GMP synthase-like glutamine amidotransferase